MQGANRSDAVAIARICNAADRPSPQRMRRGHLFRVSLAYNARFAPLHLHPFMTLAFVLYKYFPYGGLQRDFLRIALACQRRGCAIRVYCLHWSGDIPDGFDVRRAPTGMLQRAWQRHRRNLKFSAWLAEDLQCEPVWRVVGFNKMPGLDVYYAADGCFAAKPRHRLQRLSGRDRHFAAYEAAVFGPQSTTHILMISRVQWPLFVAHYGTPPERMTLLPPGIAPDRRAPVNAADIRAAFRQEFGLDDDALLLLQIGSGFKTKGLDRSLRALAALPPELKARTQLIAIGEDNPGPFAALAKRLHLSARVRILKGRSDIPRFLLGADLLIHPARHENTGTVLLEALVSGLPVLTHDVCGYAHYIADASAGVVLPGPGSGEFSQDLLNTALAELLLDAPARARHHGNALAFAQSADIYSLPERAADVILAHDLANGLSCN